MPGSLSDGSAPREYSQAESPDILEKTYAYQVRYLRKVPSTTDTGVPTVLTELAAPIPRTEDARPAELYDNSLIQELGAEGFVDQAFRE